MGYLDNIKKLFKSYKNLAEKAILDLDNNQINYQPDQNSNSIGIIMRHLSGNMKSRWTNFFTEDGEKSWRERDDEFEVKNRTKDELLTEWEVGWQRCLTTISNLSPADLNREILIRSEKHTVIEAINRQLAHYSYHTGQIIYIAKMIQSHKWKSLSIPKGKSREFNSEYSKINSKKA